MPKYTQAAQYMDQALLQLLAKKDLADITVKEICQKAGVHRSTFYLHYETISDLLEESVGYMIDDFLAYMHRAEAGEDTKHFIDRMRTCPLDELYLITPAYLLPYLSYIRDNRVIFRAALENAGVLHLERRYEKMFRHLFSPILDRYQVAPEDREYLMTYYIGGIMSVLKIWLQADCEDTVEHLAHILQRCIARPGMAGENPAAPTKSNP